MKWFFSFFIFAATVFSQNLYQKHFPKDVYEYIVQKDFIEQVSHENIRALKCGDAVNRLTIGIGEDGGRQYVLIDYWCDRAYDNLRGMQVAYRKGKVIAYVLFDGNGRDYVSFPPYSQEEEKEMMVNILAVMDGGFAKLFELHAK